MAGTHLFTIPAGVDVSNEFPIADDGFRQSLAVLFGAPDVLPETVRIQVAGSSGTWRILRSGMVIIELLAGCADQAIVVCATKIRLKSLTPVAADRVFEVLWNVKPGV